MSLAILPFLRTPAVSITTSVRPSFSMRTSTASRVVPGISLTMTRSLPVMANLPAGAAVPGALVELGISRRAEAGVARVPASAVIAVAGQSSVFVRRGEGLEVVPVQVHFRDSQQAWISGLAPKSEVVSRGVLALKAVAETPADDIAGEG